jgi:Flp pilus assembly protein TadD
VVTAAADEGKPPAAVDTAAPRDATMTVRGAVAVETAPTTSDRDGQPEPKSGNTAAPAGPVAREERREQTDPTTIAADVVRPPIAAAPVKPGDDAGVVDISATGVSAVDWHRSRGLAALRRGDFRRAIAEFDQVIGLKPSDARGYNLRGRALDEIGDFALALADYDQAIHLEPNNPGVFHARAIFWWRNGQLDKALLDLDRAIRFNFSDARIYLDRGLVWSEKGHHSRATADFNRAMAIDRNLVATYLSRGSETYHGSE